jgi:hypothetical protein
MRRGSRGGLLAGELIGFCGHDHVVAVQPADRVRPPADSHTAMIDQQHRVMIFLFGQRGDTIDKIDRQRERGQRKHAFQPLDAIAFDQIPICDLRPQCGQFGRERRGESLRQATQRS